MAVLDATAAEARRRTKPCGQKIRSGVSPLIGPRPVSELPAPLGPVLREANSGTCVTVCGPATGHHPDQLGAAGPAAGIVEVTQGSNSYAGVPGFNAKYGFDTSSGWGADVFPGSSAP
ncbi:hypothetical protein [Streptomyces sp. NPDC059398]|uniref:hypothetical protein n=1 Tax=Streptomyces sp. NPDC059398 TaxID=3346820 RepID=UPI0036863796